ncbi:HAD family hydrolase [Micromonospora sediminicola]|uniref:HAD family hydrolase n=1 Tax=Micromonospora sediminicola TaxID=946078 RepID=UPI0033A94867
MKALMFGCDGVLVDHEIEWRRLALNRVWREEGIDWEIPATDRWADRGEAGDYGYLLALRDDPLFRAALHEPVDDARWPERVAGWHRRRTEHCLDTARTRGARARTGVRRLAREALAEGWRVVVASVQPRSSMDLVTAFAFDPDMVADVVVVSGAGTAAAERTPGLFALATAAVEVDPSDCLVVESTRGGLLGATALNMHCVITPTSATFHADFSEARLVVTGLGDPGAPPEVVIGGRILTTARSWYGLRDLEELLSAAPGIRRQQATR